MGEKIVLGISSCLLGQKVRYDGGHRLDRYLTDELGMYVDWRPVCPEVEMGLTVPREVMRLAGNPEYPHLVTIMTGIDYTDRMIKWAENRIAELGMKDIRGYVFKSRSPSCGIDGVDVFDESGFPIKIGPGIFAGLFMNKYPLLPVESEEGLRDSLLRKHFFDRLGLADYLWKAGLSS